MSRLGRSQPIQPIIGHGFVDPGPGPVGTVPPKVVVVPLDERGRRALTPVPILLSGAGVVVTAPSAAPPPVVVPVEPRRPALLPRVTATHGFVDPGPGPVGTTPPLPTVTPVADRRRRVVPDAVVLSGGAAVPVAPAVNPPGLFVVPLDERNRRPAAAAPFVSQPQDDTLPPTPQSVEPVVRRRDRYRAPEPTVISGPLAGVFLPTVSPPAPTLAEPDDRRRRVLPPLDPFAVGAVLAASAQAALITPPGPYVVPIQERRRLLAELSYSHGFVDPQVSVTATAGLLTLGAGTTTTSGGTSSAQPSIQDIAPVYVTF